MSSRFILPFADVGSGIKPSSGAKLFFFEVDGVTPKDTFSDQLSTPTTNTNPVISDSNGVFGDIYITGQYKVTLQNKNGSQIFGGAVVDEVVTGQSRVATVSNYAELSDAIEDTTTKEGGAANIKELATGNGGGSMFDVVLASSVTIDPDNGIYQSTGAPTLALVQRRTGSIEVLIPTDFGDIKSAIDFYMASATFADRYINIVIETGHLLTKGAQFRHGDFSRFKVIAEGGTGTIKLDPSFEGVTITDPDYIPGIVVASTPKPLFYGVDCVMPELWALIDMENLYGEGVLIVNSKMFVFEDCGVINAGERGLNARNSQVWAANTNWSGANSTGVRAQLASNVTVGGTNIDDCCKTLEQSNGAVYVSRASTVEFRFGTAKNSGGVGITCRRSIVSAANVDISGAASHGVVVESVGVLDIIGSNADNCGGSGLFIRNNSTVSAGTLSAKNCTESDIRIDSGGSISINALTETTLGVASDATLADYNGIDNFNVTSGNGVITLAGTEPVVTTFEAAGSHSTRFADGTQITTIETDAAFASANVLFKNAIPFPQNFINTDYKVSVSLPQDAGEWGVGADQNNISYVAHSTRAVNNLGIAVRGNGFTAGSTVSNILIIIHGRWK